METKKTFEELVSEAALIADQRTKIFNQLNKKIDGAFIPGLCKIMKSYGLKSTVLDLVIKPTSWAEQYDDAPTYTSRYGLKINVNGDMESVGYNYILEKWENISSQVYASGSYGLLKSGALGLANAIKKEIARLNEKYENYNKQATELINKN